MRARQLPRGSLIRPLTVQRRPCNPPAFVPDPRLSSGLAHRSLTGVRVKWNDPTGCITTLYAAPLLGSSPVIVQFAGLCTNATGSSSLAEHDAAPHLSCGEESAEQYLLNANSIDEVLDAFNHDTNKLKSGSALIQCFVALLRVASRDKETMATLSKDRRVREFLDCVVEKVPSFPMNVVTLYLRHCAKNGFHDEKLVSALVTECQSRPLPEEFTGSVLWALVTLGVHKETKDLFTAAAYRVGVTLEADCVPSSLANLANTIYVLVVSGNWVEKLTPSLLRYLDVHLDTWEDIYSLAVFVWALVKQRVNLQRHHPTLLSKVGRVAAKRVSTSPVHPLDLNMLSWAFAVKGVYQEDFFHALADKFTTTRDPEFFEPRMLSSVAWASSRVRFYHPELLKCISEHSLRKLDQYNSHDLGNLAYAYGRLNHPDRQLLEAIVDRFESNPHLMANSQSCYNTAWACMVIDYYPIRLLQHALSPGQVEGTAMLYTA